MAAWRARTSSTSRRSPRTSPATPSRVLLDAVSLGVDRGERIGVVGLNGGGKTTLLDILAGDRAPGGRAGQPGRRAAPAHLAQGDALPAGARVRDVVLRRYGAEHEWAADPKVRGRARRAWACTTWTAPSTGCPAARSAGSRWRAALVGELDLRACSTSPPTTSTSRASAGWPQHLVARRCAVVVVTHDRWFLDTVCTRTWEVAGGRVESYLGGYADWVFARAERSRQADAAEARRRNLARKELAWLRRGPPARTSKPRYRIEAAEALIADVPAAAGHRRAARASRPTGSGAPCWSWRTRRSGSAEPRAARPRHLAARAGRPDRDRRASTARARRRCCAR